MIGPDLDVVLVGGAETMSRPPIGISSTTSDRLRSLIAKNPKVRVTLSEEAIDLMLDRQINFLKPTRPILLPEQLLIAARLRSGQPLGISPHKRTQNAYSEQHLRRLP